MTSNIIDIDSCLDERDPYLGVAKNIVDTLEDDRFLLDDRFREGVLKLSRMMCECAEGKRAEKWCRAEDVLKPDEKKTKRSGFSTESFDEEAEKTSGVTYRGGYVRKSIGER
jgi:hypothetical protein